MISSRSFGRDRRGKRYGRIASRAAGNITGGRYIRRDGNRFRQGQRVSAGRQCRACPAN